MGRREASNVRGCGGAEWPNDRQKKSQVDHLAFRDTLKIVFHQLEDIITIL